MRPRRWARRRAGANWVPHWNRRNSIFYLSKPQTEKLKKIYVNKLKSLLALRPAPLGSRHLTLSEERVELDQSL